MPNLDEKHQALKDILSSMQSVLIGFSGGTDSALLLKVAYDVLGGSVLGVTAYSATLGDAELEAAKRVAAEIGAPHLTVEADELTCEDFVKNPPERCYFCKKFRFSVLQEIQVKNGLGSIADGTNADDEGDWRPGMKAASELGVRSPLREAGLTKSDIRALSERLGLPTWNKPSMACLASRVPYGEPVTEEKLKQIAAAEDFLRALGLPQLRVRHHGAVARIEVAKEDFDKVIDNADYIVARFKAIGFDFASLDLAGFKSGSMNTFLHNNPRFQE